MEKKGVRIGLAAVRERDLTLRVSAGSAPARVGGLLLVIAGGQVLGTAAGAWYFGHALVDGDGVSLAARDSAWRNAPTVFALSGLALLVTGVVILVTHPRTQVATEP